MSIQDLHQIFELFGQLSLAVVALLAAARPVILVLKALSLLTPWSWDEAFLEHLDRVHSMLDKALRAVTSAKK